MTKHAHHPCGRGRRRRPHGRPPPAGSWRRWCATAAPGASRLCHPTPRAVGTALLAAKRDLPHGEWGELFAGPGRAPFTDRTAQMLMVVARHPVISNANHGSYVARILAALRSGCRGRRDGIKLKHDAIRARS